MAYMRWAGTFKDGTPSWYIYKMASGGYNVENTEFTGREVKQLIGILQDMLDEYPPEEDEWTRNGRIQP